MYIDTATADELYRLLLDVQDRLGYLIEDDLLTLSRDAEQELGSFRRQKAGQFNVSWFPKFDWDYRRGGGEVVVDGRLAMKLS